MALFWVDMVHPLMSQLAFIEIFSSHYLCLSIFWNSNWWFSKIPFPSLNPVVTSCVLVAIWVHRRHDVHVKLVQDVCVLDWVFSKLSQDVSTCGRRDPLSEIFYEQEINSWRAVRHKPRIPCKTRLKINNKFTKVL